MEFFGFVLLSIAILLVMVLIHEAGHYTAAKILGFTVNEFSVGFGPKLFSRRRKNGELFSFRLLPLGGFCAFYGETDDIDAAETGQKAPAAAETAESTPQPAADTATEQDDLLTFAMREKEKEREHEDAAIEKAAPTPEEHEPVRLDKDGRPATPFFAQKPWKRIIVLFGGVLFNFLSAIIFSLIYIWAVGAPTSQITEVYSDPGGVVYCPDLMVGDIILAVDGHEVTVMDSFSSLAAEVEEGRAVEIRVDRHGEILSVEATRRKIVTVQDGKESEYVGFGFSSQTAYIDAGAGSAFLYCVPYTFKLSWSILGSFGSILTGQQSITSMSGPVGSINFMAQVSAADWRNILILLPLLASNLAIFNILPFPALDGAHVVFTVIEWIRKKPINRKVEGMIHFIGMAVLLLFVLVVDILSFVL